MDEKATQTLRTLLNMRPTAALGTLRDEAPFVSMVLFAAARNFSAFYIHASKLAFHTQDMLRDPRVSLMIQEAENAHPDPQQLARISILGQVWAMQATDDDFGPAHALYLNKFPQNEHLFGFGDFAMYRIVPTSARYVAGFARAFNLTPASLRSAALEKES